MSDRAQATPILLTRSLTTDLNELDLATDQPLVLLARRRTGVKNGGGTARDVVSFLARSRPRISLTPGAGLPRGRSLSLRARGLDSSARPPVPRAVPPRRPASARKAGVRDKWKR